MSQVRIGTVDVTNGSQVVSGSGTNWLSSVSANDLFIIQGESVIYRIASVASDTQLSLSSNYVGVTAAALPYVVHIDFTTSGIPLMQDGDIETVSIYNLAVVSLEQGLAFGTYYLGAFAVAPTETGAGGAITKGMMYFDTVTDLLNVYDGSVWYDGAASAIAAAQSAAEAAADAVQTGLDRVQTGLDRVQTTSDRIQTISDAAQTASDRVQTGLDRTQTNLDVTQTTLDAAATAADRVQTTADAVQTNLDVTQTILDAAQTAADRVQTGLDATQTGLDRVQTTADRIQTISDAAATAADRVQTGLDRVQTGIDATQTTSDAILTAADRVQTGLDAVDTAADAVQTGLDRLQTTADAAQTASDRVQTGLDATQTASDRLQTVADAAQTAADRVQTSADRVQTISDAASTAADRIYVDGVEASVAAIEVSINNTFDTFDDRFLGTFTTDPTLDNDGNPISVGAVYYNSVELATKFYNGSTWDDPSQSASTSATNALNSENAAALSETNAAASELAAATSETNALASENAASVSETNAATSETNAAASEVNALASKNSAEAAEVNALASKLAAATSEANASASETAAGISEANSLASKNAAALSETNSAASELNAATSETNAAASQSAALISENNAATSELNAATSETNAAASEIAAAASYDEFDDRYLGPKASDPTLDNDGNALLTGAIYWNTAEDVMKVYTGSLWKLVSTVVEGVYQVTEFTNIATQSTITITYDIGLAQVLYNGVQLSSSDFTATNGTTIVLASPVALADDIITVILWGAVTSSSLVGTAAAFDTGVTTGTIPFAEDVVLIQPSGFVGINLTDPDEVLEVSGDLKISGSGFGIVHFGDISDSTKIIGRDSAHASSPSTMEFWTNSSESMTIDATGNVGIGTSTVTDYGGTALQIHASSGSAARIKLTNATSGSTTAALGGSLTFDTSNILSLLNRSAGAITLGTSNAERVRIDSSGNVGIGTSSPSYKTVISDGGASGIEFGPAYSGTSNLIQHYSRSGAVYVDVVNVAARHRFNIGATEKMRLDSSGNLLVGKTTLNVGVVGHELRDSGYSAATRDGATVGSYTRLTSDGTILEFRKDSTTVGSWMSRSSAVSSIILDPRANESGFGIGTTNGTSLVPTINTGGLVDNSKDLGEAATRWKDLYLSGGILFGVAAGSVTSNKLDDYEEGTWTPTGTGISPVTCYYTKIGRQVYCMGYFSTSATVSSFSGLPFAFTGSTGGRSLGTSGYNNFTNTVMSILQSGDANSFAFYVGPTSQSITTGNVVYFNLTYITNA